VDGLDLPHDQKLLLKERMMHSMVSPVIGEKADLSTLGAVDVEYQLVEHVPDGQIDP